MSITALNAIFKEAGFFVPQSSVKAILNFLQETDDHALESVKQNIGGPFGARFVILSDKGDILPVGKNVGNAVVSSGIASRHAEHENWTQNWDLLVDSLEYANKEEPFKGQKKMLIELSSGESCINCHTKQELGFEKLYRDGLLKRGVDVAHVVSGASYRQTADVAGFNDLVYLFALQNIKGLDNKAGYWNKIYKDDVRQGKALAGQFKHEHVEINDVPPKVARIFTTSDEPVVVVWRKGDVFAVGHDKRSEHFSRTPEVVALQNACTKNRDKLGVFESWDLGGAKQGVKIYTSTREIGPLMLAEGYWSNALNFISVKHNRQGQWQTQEHPEMSNDAFLVHVAEQSENIAKRSYVPTENKAQIYWRNKDDAVNYDGAKTEPG